MKNMGRSQNINIKMVSCYIQSRFSWHILIIYFASVPFLPFLCEIYTGICFNCQFIPFKFNRRRDRIERMEDGTEQRVHGC